MSATLTWRTPGSLFTRSAATLNAYYADMASMINAKAADPNYSWQVASVNSGTFPCYVVLKKKSGVPGRALFIAWDATPGGGWPTTIVDTGAAINFPYVAWFPNGNVDTPSNLTNSTGTIMGNDTGVVKCACGAHAAGFYSTQQLFYFDSAEAIYVASQAPGAATGTLLGAGDILVDIADNVYGGVFGSGTGGGGVASNAYFLIGGILPWSATKVAAGGTAGSVRANLGGLDKVFYQSFSAPGGSGWFIAGTDWMTDGVTGKVYFLPAQLLGQNKDQYLWTFKLRQVAGGPAAGAPFSTIRTTGLTVAATYCCGATAGGVGYPWFTNFKL